MLLLLQSSFRLHSRHANLIVSILRDVPDPRQCLVSALLNDLEVSDLDATDGEIRNLKLDGDGRLGVRTQTAGMLVRRHGRQTEMGAHQELLLTLELLDAPHNRRTLRNVLRNTHRTHKHNGHE